MADVQQTAIASLEVVLRGVLQCEPNDRIEIVPSTADGNAVRVIGFSVVRRAIELARYHPAIPPTDQEYRVRFLETNGLIQVGDRACILGSYFINAVNNFLCETLEPDVRGSLS